jgi:hypothetical protein
MESSLDSGVAPSRIVDGHLYDEMLNLTLDPWPTWTAPRASIVFLRDQLPIPAKERIWGNHGGNLAEPAPSNGLRPASQPAALGVGEADALSA